MKGAIKLTKTALTALIIILSNQHVGLSIFALFVLFYYFWQAVIIGCITMVLLQIWAEKTEVGVKYSFLFILICWAFESSL